MDRLPTPVLLDFPGGLDGKEFACNMGDLGSIPGLGRSPGGGCGLPREFHGQRSLVGYLHGVVESNTAELRLSAAQRGKICLNVALLFTPQKKAFSIV